VPYADANGYLSSTTGDFSIDDFSNIPIDSRFQDGQTYQVVLDAYGRSQDTGSTNNLEFPLYSRVLYMQVTSNPKGPQQPVASPQMTFPFDGFTMPQGCYNLNWHFAWTPVAGAEMYELYVQHQGSPHPMGTYSTTLPSYTLQRTGGIINYYDNWQCKVRAYVNGGWTDYSNVVTFNVAPANCEGSSTPPSQETVTTCLAKGEALDGGECVPTSQACGDMGGHYTEQVCSFTDGTFCSDPYLETGTCQALRDEQNAQNAINNEQNVNNNVQQQNTPRTNEYWPGSSPTACTPGSAHGMCKSSNSCVDCTGQCYSEGHYTSSKGNSMDCSQGKWTIASGGPTPTPTPTPTPPQQCPDPEHQQYNPNTGKCDLMTY
jgi:hypothetical protein